MGGSVTVGFRFRDGTTSAQIRHTNPMSFWMHDPRMFVGDPEFIADYISKAEDKSLVPLAPDGYGLVVVDFKENRLLSMQGYTSFGRISASCFAMDITDDDDDLYGQLLKANKLSETLFKGYPDGRREFIEKHPITVDHVSKLIPIAHEMDEKTYKLQKGNVKCALRWEFGIDTSPLVVEKFGQGSPQDALAMMARMRELGFDVDADAAVWHEFIGEEVTTAT